MKEKGFTYIEVVVAMAMVLMTLGAVGTMLRQYKMGKQHLYTQEAVHTRAHFWALNGEEVGTEITTAWVEEVVALPLNNLATPRVALAKTAIEVPMTYAGNSVTQLGAHWLVESIQLTTQGEPYRCFQLLAVEEAQATSQQYHLVLVDVLQGTAPIPIAFDLTQVADQAMDLFVSLPTEMGSRCTLQGNEKQRLFIQEIAQSEEMNQSPMLEQLRMYADTSQEVILKTMYRLRLP